MPLLGGYLQISEATGSPLRIFEIGASAGLNLRWDSYYYEGQGWSWGNRASVLALRNSIEAGEPMHLAELPKVIERRGCDLNPLHVPSETSERELLSFVWADQIERFTRLRSALNIAKVVPVQIDEADGVEWLEQSLIPKGGSTTVIVHSVLTEHLGSEARTALRKAVYATGETATNDSAVAWLRMEPEGGCYRTRVTLWPGNRAFAICESDGHGQGMRWL
ncbi:MAG TPA: DUF2332 domain-containing protein [Candidatus Tumulicola sp.]|nr:DUF2332 domain-containing protein [Candidatus Tumulicola sp.]